MDEETGGSPTLGAVVVVAFWTLISGLIYAWTGNGFAALGVLVGLCGVLAISLSGLTRLWRDEGRGDG